MEKVLVEIFAEIFGVSIWGNCELAKGQCRGAKVD